MLTILYIDIVDVLAIHEIILASHILKFTIF